MRVHTMLPIVAVAVTVACRGGTTPTLSASFLDSRSECPKEWVFAKEPRYDGDFAVPGGQLSVPREIQNVPEFHDCQRFLVEDQASRELVYGARYAIFAAKDLGRTDTLEMLNDTTLGEGDKDEIALASRLTAGLATAAAEIVADSDYAPLKILRGFNCLYVYLEGPQDWHAKMVPSGTVEQDCSEPVDPNELHGDTLAVRLTGQGHGFTRHDFPKAARWDWDSVRTQHYIGTRCGAAWCEVGDFDFVSSKDRAERFGHPSAGSPVKLRRSFYVKGWYDEQELAIRDGASVVPSGIWGVIVPDSMLEAYSESDFQGWARAAEVALTVPEGVAVNPYQGKYNFTHTDDPISRPNRIYLCKVQAGAACELSNPDIPKTCEGDGDEAWRARIINALGEVAYRCVKRCDYTGQGFDVPGTARWRWLKDDEGAWMRCLQGCCELHGQH